MFDEMERRGLRSNVVTYSIMIDVHGKSGNSEKAMQLFDEMEKKGLNPNEVTYTTMIDVYLLATLRKQFNCLMR